MIQFVLAKQSVLLAHSAISNSSISFSWDSSSRSVRSEEFVVPTDVVVRVVADVVVLEETRSTLVESLTYKMETTYQ
jgi:hypothetical protein